MKITNILYTFYVIKNVNKIRKKVEKYLIIGLGNPGVQYNNTRHQVGHMVLDAFALKNNLEFKPSSLGGEITQFIVENKLVYLAKPMTFMNLSGEFVKRFTDYYNISINNIFVIYDDVSIILGKYKIKKDGLSGGHNGIKNIIKNLQTENFKRLKIGILNDTVYKTIEVKDYVLGKFSSTDLQKITTHYPIFFEIMKEFAIYNIDDLMNKYNNN